MTRSASGSASWSVLCVAVLLLPVTLVVAQQAAPQVRSTPAFQTIRGKVASTDTGSPPLRRVRIVLTAGDVVSTPSHTDEAGRFEMAVPATAPYALTFSKPGFAPQTIRRQAADAGRTVDVTLEKGAAVTAWIVDQFGDFLIARLRARRLADDARQATTQTEWTTDGDDRGETRIGSLPAGRYELTVQPGPGVRSSSTGTSARPPTVVRLRAGEEATVTLVEHTEPVDPRGTVIGGSRTPVVTNGGIIRGRVVADDSRPVGGAFIMLAAGFESARQTATAADGTYEFAGLPPATYRVSAGKIPASLTMAGRDPEVTVQRTEIVQAEAIVLRRPSAVTGTVLDEFGDPVEGVTVEVLRTLPRDGRNTLARPAEARPRLTDDRGRFRVFAAPPGEYYVSAGERSRGETRLYHPGTLSIRDAATVRVAAGADTSGVTVAYTSQAGARVSGYAFDSNGQRLTFPVTLMESVHTGTPVTARRTAMPGEDGAFAFQNVPPGDYVIQGVRRPTPGRDSEFGVTFVTVTDDGGPPVTVRTSGGTTLKGRVVLEGAASTVTVDSFGIGLSSSDPDYEAIGLDSPGIGAGEDGTFELRGLGPMRLAPRASPPGWWMKSATIGGVDAADEPYTFPPVSALPLETVVVFSDTVGEITGRALDARDRPTRNAYVLAFPVDQRRWFRGSRYLEATRPGVGAAVDSRPVNEGGFRLASLPPADYWIVAVDRFDSQADWSDADLLRTLAASAQRVTVTGRQRVVQDLHVVERAPR